MMRRIVGFPGRIYQILLSDFKIKYKLIVAFSVFTIIPILLLGISSYTMMKNSLEDNEKKMLLQSMTQLNNSIDYFLASYVNTSSMLFNNLELQEDLKAKPDDLYDILDIRSRITFIISQIKNSFKFPEIKDSYYAEGVTVVKMFLTNSNLSSLSGDFMPLSDVVNETWCKKLYEPGVFCYWQSDVNYNGMPYIALNRRLVDLSNGNDLGVMRIYLPVVRIQNIIKQNTQNSRYKFFYVDDSFKSIVKIGVSNEDEHLLDQIRQLKSTSIINEIETDSGKYIIGAIESNIAGWKLIFLTPFDIITSKTRNVSTVTAFSVLITLAMCVFISVLVGSWITGRMRILVDKTDSVVTDNLTISTIIGGKDEIGQMDRNFNRMIQRINNLIENEYRAKININKTKLELLQEQINPHMLYNTLLTISATAKNTGSNDILNVTNSLIGFYKGILNKGKVTASLREEINMVKLYLEIIGFVYPMELDCTFEIDDNILKYYSIKLLLQPVVENAIIHGLRPNNGGMLFISGRAIDDSIEFIVADNGVGIPEDVQKYLNSALEREDIDKSYGLGNVIKRIGLFFGKDYGMKIESSIGMGTTVTFTVPKLSEEDIKQLLKSKYLL